jgi:hypothetical protein
MAKTLNVNGTQMANVTANGVPINRVYINGVLVFEKTTPVTDELTIDPEAIGISSDQQSYTIDVFSNTDWDVSEQLSEASLSASSGSGNGTITVKVLENTSSSERVRSFSFYAGDLIVTHTFTQEGIPEVLTIDPTSQPVSNAEETYTIDVTSNTSWTASEDLSWASFVGIPSGSGNGSVTVKVNPNSSSSTRTGKIIFTTENINVEHTINQAATPPPFNDGELNEHTVSNSSTSFGACNGSVNKTVYSQSINFSNSSILYNESNGATRANAGFYSKGSSVIECGNEGNVINSGFCQ